MPNNFRLADAQIAPTAPSWRDATTQDRLAFYEEAADRVLSQKRTEALRAIGADGHSLTPRKRPHPQLGASAGPALVPHREAARTVRLMRAKATSRGVTIYWLGGLNRRQRTPWGRILGYHAEGAGPLPVRDHMGLSPTGTRQVRAEMRQWWTQYLRKKTRAENKRYERERSSLVGRYRELAQYFRSRKEGF